MIRMEPITTQNGETVNYLKVNKRDLAELRAWLGAEGVRIREVESNTISCLVQIENCYKTGLGLVSGVKDAAKLEGFVDELLDPENSWFD